MGDKDQLIVMVTIQDLDVDARLGHPARKRAELTGYVLLQPLNEYVPFRENMDAGCFQGALSLHPDIRLVAKPGRALLQRTHRAQVTPAGGHERQ